jgi:hypothetical protein
MDDSLDRLETELLQEERQRLRDEDPAQFALKYHMDIA